MFLNQHVPNRVSLPADDWRRHCRPCFSPEKHFHRTLVPVSLLVVCDCHQSSFLSEKFCTVVMFASCLLCSFSTAMLLQPIFQFAEKGCFPHNHITQPSVSKNCSLISSDSFPNYPKLDRQRPIFIEFNQFLFS